jgi:quinoprotein glucose dehydrogenase
MPGNQGGSNWGTTAANPEKGLVYVLNIDAVAILKLDNTLTKVGGFQAGGGRGGPAGAGAALFQQHCQACHGADLQNPIAGVPSLVGVTERLSEDVVRATITGGKGMMRPISGLSAADLTALLAYLSNPAGGRGGFGGRGGPAATFPPGPVVASGGIATPPQPSPFGAPASGPRYPGNGGNGGNTPYPPDVDVPPERYVSEWGVMANATKPPYSTLVAYDLNKGTIRWQTPVGDDPATILAGGPKNTGSPMMRNGIIPTKSGLVFIAGNDGTMRAYDEDNGKLLWTGVLPGPSRGVPVVYEAKGREYLVVAATPPSGGRGGGAGRGAPAAAPADPATPRGYIAFALPGK